MVSPSGAPSSAVGLIFVVIVGEVSTQAEAVEAPVKVFAASVLAIVAEVVGNVITVESVPERVRVFVTENTFKLVIVSVPVEEVMVNPFIEVAVATPISGVVNVGEVKVLFVSVLVELKVGTESAFVPTLAEVIRNSPAFCVRIPAVCVRVTFPALKLITPPLAKKRSANAVPEAPNAPESFAVANTDGVVIEVAKVGAVDKTTVEPEPVVVAALIAVPFPAKTGEFMEVVRVIAGVVVEVATEPVKPLALTTLTEVTVPDPEAESTKSLWVVGSA